jgi:glutaredoxin
MIMKKPQIFTSERCVYCHMLEDKLNKSGIDFEKVSLDDLKGLKKAMKEGIKSLPTVKINGKTIVGFSEENVKVIMDEVSKLREQVCGEKGQLL